MSKKEDPKPVIINANAEAPKKKKDLVQELDFKAIWDTIEIEENAWKRLRVQTAATLMSGILNTLSKENFKEFFSEVLNGCPNRELFLVALKMSDYLIEGETYVNNEKRNRSPQETEKHSESEQSGH